MSNERHQIDRAKVRELREQAGLSQGQLATKTGLAQQTIAAIEQGIALRPFPSTVAAIARVLDVQVSDLRAKSDGGGSFSLPTTGPPAVSPTGESDA